MADTDTATAPTTVEELRASSPDLVAAIEAEAHTQGVSAERARITEIIEATRQAIAGEPAEGEAAAEPNVEAQALDLIVTATKDGKAANTLMASLLKLSRASVKATAVPASAQEARRAVTAAADAIDAAFRAANGGDQDKPLCGGCVAAVVNNLFLEMLRRGDPTLGQAGGWALTMKRNMEKIVHGAASEAYRDGGDRTGDKVYRDKPKPRKRKKT